MGTSEKCLENEEQFDVPLKVFDSILIEKQQDTFIMKHNGIEFTKARYCSFPLNFF